MKRHQKKATSFGIWKLIGNVWEYWAVDLQSEREAQRIFRDQYGDGFCVVRVTYERLPAQGKDR